MEATIPAPALRSFSRVVQCLAKIGDYLTLEAKRNKLLLSSVNASCSAFALFTLSRQYFDQYHLIANATSDPEATCRCRVLIKVDKNVQVCQIALDADPEHLTDGDESYHRLAIKLACKHGIAKHYRLYYEPTEALYAVYAKHTCSHRWQVSPKLMTEWASHFNPRLEEITMVCSPEAVILRSFSEGGFLTVADGTTAKDAIKQSLQTQLQIDPEDFDVYSVVHHTELTFSFREFRAILAFAEQTNLQLSAYFDVPGRPILFAIQSTDHMAADFVLATLTEAMSTTSASSTQQSTLMAFSAAPRDQASHYSQPSSSHPRPISPEIGSSLVSASPALTPGTAGPSFTAPTAATSVPPPSSAPKTPTLSGSSSKAMSTTLPPTPSIRRLDFEPPTTTPSTSTAPTDRDSAAMEVESPALHTPSSVLSTDQGTSSLPPTRSFASTTATPLSIFHRPGPAKPLPPSSSASGSVSEDPRTPLPALSTRPAPSPWTTETVVAPTPGAQVPHSLFDAAPERLIQLPSGMQDHHPARASASPLTGSAPSENGSDSDELEATPPRNHQPRSLFG
ncbi:hypothetical protein H4R34_003879 [Dimargaris verticillata]|uniref:Cell cycle checkpoint control protein RAD9A n=1 Tax=Dimargaris verticillata TaxID=2761393 RepID=A0A9W8B3P4_9FUNG|nr:hypothetical protein H4R34_003879 [Dimargaris verticillata]